MCENNCLKDFAKLRILIPMTSKGLKSVGPSFNGTKIAGITSDNELKMNSKIASITKLTEYAE